MSILDIEPYRGVCIVHAIYDADIIGNIAGDIIDDNDKKEFFYNDWYNYDPDNSRILHGSGYVRTIEDKQYIITCNHIMVKYALYVGYCYDEKLNIVSFNMKIYSRIPELDLVIMEIITKLENKLLNLPNYGIIPTNIKELYDIESKNVLIAGEKDPGSVDNIPLFSTIDINTQINMIYDILKFRSLSDIPLLNIPVYEIDMIKKISDEYKIDLKIDMKEMNPRRHVISKIIANKLSGTSGAIVRSNNINIGMCCMYMDTNKGISLRALPLFLIDMIIVNNILFKQPYLMGIHINTLTCEIEYMKEHKYAHYVTKQSPCYINGKKSFTFNNDDIILDIDGLEFNKDHLIFCELIGIAVPLNTYLMLRSNMNNVPISIKIIKNQNKDYKITKYNVSSISYNNMFPVNLNIGNYLEWNGLIFMELSEEIIMFYRQLGMNLLNNTKGVILFNYNKKILYPLKNKLLYYKSMPYTNKSGSYFYQVNYMGQKKVTSINDMAPLLSNKSVKKITFKLNNPMDDIELLKY